MKTGRTKIFIIDDEEAIRRSLSLLLRSAGYAVESYADAEEFLQFAAEDSPGCIVLDIFLKGRSGLELQQDITEKFSHLPIIYITGQGDVPMSVQALKAGAINFLQKPIDDQKLFEAIQEALELSQELLESHSQVQDAQILISSLTPRQLEIFRLLITGLLNKQIAARLNIAEHTVKLHRGKITSKLGVVSVAEMVRLAEKAGL